MFCLLSNDIGIYGCFLISYLFFLGKFMEFWKGIPHCTVQKRRNALDVDLRRNIFLFAIFFVLFFEIFILDLQI